MCTSCTRKCSHLTPGTFRALSHLDACVTALTQMQQQIEELIDIVHIPANTDREGAAISAEVDHDVMLRDIEDELQRVKEHILVLHELQRHLGSVSQDTVSNADL